MADFHQTGTISTLHRLQGQDLPRLEAELARHTRRRSIGLVLPALYSEFETPAMRRIVRELENVHYLRRIVLALDRANRDQYELARTFFSRVETPVQILWIDSDRVEAVSDTLEANGIDCGPRGKGRTCWLAVGYLLAAGDCDVIALHDCDILSYDRALLARLCYPLVHPDLGFEFAKGYYARVSERLYGRVARLLFGPLVQALEGLAPGEPLLRFLEGFRYPLSGEFAMRAELARRSRIPADWGLEVGLLAEVFRNTHPGRVCQVDLCDQYEHKHQSLSESDANSGLRRMSREIAVRLFRALAARGVALAEGGLRALPLRYLHLAEDQADRYRAEALLNGLEHSRHAEETAIAVFARSVADAAAEYAHDPIGRLPIPSWDRAVSAVPDVPARLLDAVEQDAREFAPRMVFLGSRPMNAPAIATQ